MMVVQHPSLLHQRWAAVAPHQTPCIRLSYFHRRTLAAAVLHSFRRNITLPARSHAVTIREFQRWWHSISPCCTSGGGCSSCFPPDSPCASRSRPVTRSCSSRESPVPISPAYEHARERKIGSDEASGAYEDSREGQLVSNAS